MCIVKKIRFPPLPAGGFRGGDERGQQRAEIIVRGVSSGNTKKKSLLSRYFSHAIHAKHANLHRHRPPSFCRSWVRYFFLNSRGE